MTHSIFQQVDIWKARERIKNHVLRTPLLYSEALSQLTGAKIYLKMECWQLHGCFKVRGAVSMVSALSETEKQPGLVTCSSGNHGLALAYAAGLYGNIATKIFLPEYAETTKLNKIAALGAEAVITGKDFLETLDHALQYADKSGAIYAHSHSDPFVIAGQGTIGLEIMEDLPDVETIIVQIGGGGLISGIGTAAKTANPNIKVIGVEPEAAPGAYLSFRDGKCHERVEIKASVADGLLGTLTPLTFDLSRKLVDRVVLVGEEDIIQSMKTIQETEQIMIEGSAAAGLAAVLNKQIDIRGEKAVFILTGRNISARQYNKLIQSVIL